MLPREPRVRAPALDRYSDVPLFNTKAVVRQTGIPAPTLRAWERRYGILSPRRGGNDYRLYSERDMVTVTWLRERVEHGMTISQAIALLHSLEPSAAHEAVSAGPPRETLMAATLEAETAPLALPNLARVLLERLVTLHEQAANEAIIQALTLYPVRDVCLSLFTPVLEEVGLLWEAGEIDVSTEHFAAGVIRGHLAGLFRSAGGAERGPSVLVGCAPGELHEVGPLMLALFLRRQGFRVVYLGQSVEAASVARMAAATGAVSVLLSATLADHLDGVRAVGEQLAIGQRMAESPHRAVLYFGGRAFAQEPALADTIGGHFLGMNAYDAAAEIYRRSST